MGACIIVDEQDIVLGYGESNNLKPGERIRITAVWITSPEGKILFAQRSQHKRHEPGVWATAVAGTVEPHETYDENVRKEIEEEIGITITELTLGPKTVQPHRICQWYLATIPEDTALHPNPQEVDATRWFTKDELIRFFAQSPEQFTKNADKYVHMMIEATCDR